MAKVTRKYTQGILRLGSNRKANRPPEYDGRAKLVKPSTMPELREAVTRAGLAQSAVNALGAGPGVSAVWTATRVEPLTTLGDQAKKFTLLGGLLADGTTTLKQLEDAASSCGFLVDVKFRSV